MPAGRKKISIPFHMIRNMVVIRLEVNGKGPYNFILDSGAGIVIITDPAVADSTGMQSYHTIKLTGLGEGESVDALICSNVNFNVKGIEGKGISVAVLKSDRFGMSNYAGTPIQGLIGYEFFNSLDVKFNFLDSTLTVARPGVFKAFKKGYRIPITIEQNKPYLQAKVKLDNGRTLDTKLVIDFGAGHPLMLENMIEKNGMPAHHIVANLGIGLNGPITGYLTRIKELDIGKYKFTDVITSFPTFDSLRTKEMSVERDGNLGLSILKRFTLIMDYQSGAMYLKPGNDFKKPFEHDMSGLEYYADGDDLKIIVINRVEPGSAGDITGLQKGDAIVAINFRSVSELSIQDVDNIFRSFPDRAILLDVVRDNKKFRFILTLKRRI